MAILRRWDQIVSHLLLIAGGLLMLFPFLWMISTSLKPPAEVFVFPPRWLPSHWEVGNYISAWHAAPFGRYYLNSLVVTTAVTIGELITCSMAAFAFARMRFPGRDILFALFLGTLVIPTQVTMIPSYIIISRLKWMDSYLGLTVPFLSSVFGIFLLRQFFLTIPRELEDAARIDGAGRVSFLVRIMIPLSKPALAALSIFTALEQWNSYLWPLIVTNSDKMRTLQIGLRFLMSQEGSEKWNILMAASVLSVLPVLLLYLLAQRQFVQGLTRTGLQN